MPHTPSGIFAVAKVCHEANKAYCEGLGDYSQASWADAPQWQKDSAVHGVIAHMEGDLTPEQSHMKWFELKFREGWKYGPVKSAERKEHPCMLPYSALPEEQRRKDALFKAIVDVLK